MRRPSTPTLKPRATARSLGILLAVSGCSRLEPQGAESPFALTHVRPANAEGLFLNEELVFYFNDEIEPTSITSASVVIESEAGVPARGRLEIGVDQVRFVPAPVLAADLSDGGFLPGTRYTATLAGFPRPEGLRSVRGALHERTRTWSFRTVEVAGPRRTLVFEDRAQDKVGVLRIFPSSSRTGASVASRDSIYLACDKPLDPSTVLPEAFELMPYVMDPKGIRTRVRLLENHSEPVTGPRPAVARSSSPAQGWERERRACVLEVTPEESLAQPSEYRLLVRGSAAGEQPLLRDFSGNPVLADAPAEGWRIYVRDLAGDRGRSELREDFDSRRLRSAVALPGYDGTAAWDVSGRVTVRWPAAAGSGRDGRVALGTSEDRVDVQAVSIDLAEASGCKLRATPGLVVLRSQGRMTIAGRLSREATWDPLAEIEKDPTLALWSGASRRRLPDPVPETLTRWLEAARAGDWNWTVLIAGGDLVVEGQVESSGPVLLVAGGSIRVSGSIRSVEKTVVPKRPEGAESVTLGGVFLPKDSAGDIWPKMTAWLIVDEPVGHNPLVDTLRFAVLSSPVPPSGDVLRWLPPRMGGGPSGSGWRVRYLPELATVPREPGGLHPVDDPLLLSPPGPIQFLIELEVATGGVWDPPWVDFVHLAWERTADSPSPFGGR